MKKKVLKISAIILAAIVLFVGGLLAGKMDLGYDSAPSARNALYAEESMLDYGAAPAVMTSASGASAAMKAEARKIIRTADMTIRTTAFEDCASKVQALIAENGGYVENLYQYGESIRRLNLTIRVPSDRLDGFLASLEGAGRVTDRSESTTDMTTQYQDNEARLSTLYAKRDRLNELLLKAEDVSDLIEIESAIADTQYQIDSYETSQRSIDRQVDMSSVSLTIIEETPADSARADISLIERIGAAFTSSIEWLGEFGQDLIVFIAALLPVAAPIAVIAVIIVFIRKRRK